MLTESSPSGLSSELSDGSGGEEASSELCSDETSIWAVTLVLPLSFCVSVAAVTAVETTVIRLSIMASRHKALNMPSFMIIYQSDSL